MSAVLAFLLFASPDLCPGCKHVWTLTLDNGDKLVVRTVWAKEGIGSGAGEWLRGGKPFDKAQFHVSGGPASFELDRSISQAELLARMQGLQAALQSPKGQALQERETDANLKWQKCNADKKPTCDDTLRAELKAVKAEQQELTRAAVGALKSCEQLHLQAADGKLTGQADNCADGKSHAVAGTLKVEP